MVYVRKYVATLPLVREWLIGKSATGHGRHLKGTTKCASNIGPPATVIANRRSMYQQAHSALHFAFWGSP